MSRLEAALGLGEGELMATVSVAALTLLLYYVAFGKRHSRRRQDLQSRLAEAEGKVEELQRLLEELDENENDDLAEKEPVRVWVDGAFDLTHYGHMNAFRQARAYGTELIVGVNNSASIAECKGTAPIMTDEERCGAVRGCKWVDKVVQNVPYVLTSEYLNRIIEEYKIDFVVHGDDPCIVDGKDVYAESKRRGIYKEIPRTPGVSTSDIVGRMIYSSKEHHGETGQTDLISRERRRSASFSSQHQGSPSGFYRPSNFLTTSRILRIFSAGIRDPPSGAKIVYIDGAWDLFHKGHVETLKGARAEGDYLIVGIHSDKVINDKRGRNFPIMNLNERLLSVLGCRYVDDVLIDAPWIITAEMIASLGVSLVVRGTVSDTSNLEQDGRDPYEIPKKRNRFKIIESESVLSVEKITGRVLSNKEAFVTKVDTKMKAEGEYYSKRYERG